MTNSKPKTWSLTIQDSADGTGDGIITLPDDLLAESGWGEGDTLEIETMLDGRIYIYRSLTPDCTAHCAERDR